jgi:hypothetical protein
LNFDRPAADHGYMFVFAHTGIGNAVVRSWRRDLSRGMVLIGALLPDLIDKPVYYGVSLLAPAQPMLQAVISGTRTFAHTALFVGLIAGVAIALRSKAIAALALGVTTHLVLDAIGDSFGPDVGDDMLTTILWPILGWHFPQTARASLVGHLSVYATTPFFLAGEILGATLLLLEFRATSSSAGRADS